QNRCRSEGDSDDQGGVAHRSLLTGVWNGARLILNCVRLGCVPRVAAQRPRFNDHSIGQATHTFQSLHFPGLDRIQDWALHDSAVMLSMTAAATTRAATMQVGIISDTHGLMRPEALAALAGSDLIIHAGDIGKP